MKRLLLSLFVLAALCAAGLREVRAQAATTYTMVLRGLPLQEALEQVVRVTRIDLVYTSELVAGKHTYCAARGAAAEGLLACVLAGSGLDYVRSSSGAYVLIAARQERPRVGDLGGSVVDGETGAPLPYANVLLADAATGTTTNEAGLFGFSSLVSGLHRVVVTYVGYETVVDSVWVVPGARQRITVALDPVEVAMPPVVVDGLQQRLPSGGLGLGEVGGAALAAFAAGAVPDVARAAAGLVGVATQQPLADLHVQGGASGEHLTLLDGVPVRDPVSLGRHLGAFSPLALQRVTVHKAGFGVEHGSHLSAVVDVSHDLGGEASHGLAFSVDPVSVNARGQARLRLAGGRQGAAMVAVRQSAWGVYHDPGLSGLLREWGAVDPLLASRWLGADVSRATLGLRRYEPAIAFSDVHAALRLHLSPFRVLYASAYQARNHIASEGAAFHNGSEGGRLVLTRDDYDWDNWAGQVRHSWLLGARAIATVGVQGAVHASRYAYHALAPAAEGIATPAQLEAAAAGFSDALGAASNGTYRHRIGEAALKAELEHSFSPRYHAAAGFVASHVSGRIRFVNPFVLPLWHEAAGWEMGGYLRARLSPGLRTTIEPGVRLTWLPVRSTLYAEPRLAVRYDGDGGRLGPYALRLAAGIYRQFTNQYELTGSAASTVIPSLLFWLPPDGTVAPPRAYHVAAEALFTPAPAWSLSLEAYYKGQPRLLVLDYAALATGYYDPLADAFAYDQAAFAGAAAGRAYGGGVRLHRAGRRLTATATYSFSRAAHRLPGRFDGRMVPVPWNEPHRLLVRAEARLGPALTADASWHGGWGRRWALRRAYYDYLALQSEPPSFGPYDPADPSAQALPPSRRLDVGLAYRHAWSRADVSVYASVVNVLDRRDVYDWSLERAGDGAVPVARTLPGRQPVLGLRVTL